ncbi:hypothetical protein N431DRAFT_336965 [Stipitochalara longipes BDJ]|nr:hypothetical protein N431DRAFT_336965 [Stipitochalara longipes BDJ]
MAGVYTTYVAIMMDFSVRTNKSTELIATLLHWIVTGLSCDGSTILTYHQAEIAPYFPLGPPARQTHTYGVFLYNKAANFAVPAGYIPFFNNLTTAGLNRLGFNLTDFVAETGVAVPVTADWSLVNTSDKIESSTMIAKVT